MSASLTAVQSDCYSQDRIASFDDGTLKVLKGTISPLARPENDRGPLEDSSPIRGLQLLLSPTTGRPQT